MEFELKTSLLKKVKKCPDYSKIKNQIFFSFLWRKRSDQEVQSFFQRCPPPDLFKRLLKIEEVELKEFSFLKKSQPKDYTKIRRILGLRKRKSDKELIKTYQTLSDYSFQKREKEKDVDVFFRNREVLSLIEKMDGHFVKETIQLFVALRAKNDGWSSNIIQKLVNRHPNQLIFQSKKTAFIDKKLRQAVKQKIIEISSDNLKLIKNERLETIYEIYLSNIESFKPKIKAEWLSQKDLSEYFKSYSATQGFFNFWARNIFQVHTYNEYDEVFSEIINPVRIEQDFKKYSWIFTYFFPKNEELRKIIVKKTQDVSGGYQKYIHFNIMRNPAYSLYLAKTGAKRGRPVQFQERDFFKQMLAKGDFVDFAVYNLLRMGEYQKTMFWWVILYE